MRLVLFSIPIYLRVSKVTIFSFLVMAYFLIAVIYFMTQVYKYTIPSGHKVSKTGFSLFSNHSHETMLLTTYSANSQEKTESKSVPIKTDSDKSKNAMDTVKESYRIIMEKQRELLLSQVRPDDSSYNINITKSDSISLDREIPDARCEACKHFNYNITELPTASVVIPFYNEGLSTLLRTVQSVLNRSPDELLTEVILVDDFSDYTYLHGPLADYIKMLPKTRIIRNQERQGLIRTRMNGFREIKGDAVIFLDSHTEANVGWLEPLLDELRRHPNSVVQPAIDNIYPDTLEYEYFRGDFRFVRAGGFGWALQYLSLFLPNHEAIRALETGYPYPSPTLQGSAMAVRKEYFETIGGLDEDLKIWGGENLELGFRVWMCHGRVVTVICSHVGHMFKLQSYQFDGGKNEIIHKNLMRVAETWMDGYRKFFYASIRAFEFNRVEFTQEELSSLKNRAALKNKLMCHNFDWYMYNVIPQVAIPPTDAVYYGEISSVYAGACCEVSPDIVKANTNCQQHQYNPFNIFSITKSGLLKSRGLCVLVDTKPFYLKTGECPQTDEDIKRFGKWSVITKGVLWGQISVLTEDIEGKFHQYCVEIRERVLNHKVGNKAYSVYLTTCDSSSAAQDWEWQYKFDWSQVPQRLMDVGITMKGSDSIV